MAQAGQPYYQLQTVQQHHYPQQYQQYQQQQTFGQHQNFPHYPQQTYNVSQQYPQHYPQHYQQQHPQHYPQQYSQQYHQHNAQPYPQQYPHPHGPAQQGQQPFQQAGVNAAQAEPETCYNCGLPDHIAQSCPEPRRETPVGLLKRQRRLNNHKNNNFQFNANSQTGINAQQPQAYQQLGGPQQSSPQFYQSYYPPTPISANSPGTPQWHRQSYPQGHISINNRVAPQSPYQQQQPMMNQAALYSAPPTPVATYPIVSSADQQASPMASHRGSLSQTPHSTSGPPPPSAVGIPDDIRATRTETIENADLQEPEEDDLSLLDLPDLPQTGKQNVESMWEPVCRPLPANFIVADAILPMPPPAPEANGRCTSKYFADTDEVQSVQDMRVLPCWKDRLEDTIFQEISKGEQAISIADCLIKLKHRQKLLVENETQETSRSQSRSVAPRSSEAMEMAESLETLERALAEAKAKQAEMIRNRQKARTRRRSENKQPSEGSPGETSVKTEQQSPPRLSTSRSSERRVTNASTPTTSTTVPRDKALPMRPETRMSKDLSLSVQPTIDQCQSSQTSPINGETWHPPQHGYPSNVPPPPPPSTERVQSSNGPMQSPSSSSGERRSHRVNGTGSNPFGTHAQSGSPNQYRSEASFNHKRSYDQAADSSSSDDDESPRRQEDDITPKHKRRQPKVAEAYSRRW